MVPVSRSSPLGSGINGHGLLMLKLWWESISWVNTTRPMGCQPFVTYHPWPDYWIGIVRGFLSFWIHSPASAQSSLPDCLSTRRSTYHSPTVITNVSVVSKGVSDPHRIEMRVVRLDSKTGTDKFDISVAIILRAYSEERGKFWQVKDGIGNLHDSIGHINTINRIC